MLRTLPLLLLALACKDGDPAQDSGDPVDDTAGEVDADGDGFTESEDCDDEDASVNPDAEEICDSVDNNCDGEIDEGVTTTAYADNDADGYGDEASAVEVCEPGEGQVTQAGDCDDADGAVSPDAEEICDGLDNDCDGELDEADAVDALTFYADLDADGFGDLNNNTTACSAPSGFVTDDTDCDDANDAVYPGAEEICDALDNDCDGDVAEPLVPTDYANINEALYNGGVSWVCLEAGTHTDSASFTLVDDLRVEGVGSDQVTLDAGGTNAALTFNLGNHDLVVRGMTVTGGDSGGNDAGGLSMRGGSVGTAWVEDVVFTGNRCESNNCLGAALGADDVPMVTLYDVESYGNEVVGRARGTVGFEDCTDLVLDDVRIHDELVDDSGALGGVSGGLYVWSDVTDPNTNTLISTASLNDVHISGVSVTSNQAFYGGGALLGYLGTLDVTNSSFNDNHISSTNLCGSPGVMPFIVADVAFNNVEIAGNTCEVDNSGSAAGLYLQGTLSEAAVAELENVIIAGNSVVSLGHTTGGVILQNNIDATYRNVSVVGNDVNAATFGAGWFNYTTGSATTLVNVDYSGNTMVGVPDVATGLGKTHSSTIFTWSYSNITDLGTDPLGSGINDLTGTDGNLDGAPDYADTSAADPWDWDLSLSSSSALIDAGDPSLTDPDGSVSDIGAWGGPGAASW